MTAAFDEAANVREAVNRLLDHHVPADVMELVREPAGEPVPIRRPVRVTRSALVGLLVGALVGTVMSVVLATFAPALVLSWGAGQLIGALAIGGGLFGIFASLVRGQVKVELRTEEIEPDEHLVLGVNISEARLPELRTIIEDAGGELAAA